MRYLYTPNDRDFVYVIQGRGVMEDASLQEDQRTSTKEAIDHSTQVLIGDLKTGQEIQCSTPIWSRSGLQHKLFTPDGAHLVTISSDKMVCWKLHPLELAWETELAHRWTEPEAGNPFAAEETLNWLLEYSIHPNDESILIAADGREAILFSLATGDEEQRFGPLPINSVLRFGGNRTNLQVGFRAIRSMRRYDVSSGNLIRTYHFGNEGTVLHQF